MATEQQYLASVGSTIQTAELVFRSLTEAAGTFTASCTQPAGSTLLDIIVNGVALWVNSSTASLKVGDAGTDDGYFTGVNLKATDLLAGESISFAQAGGKAGGYIANSQVSPRYTATDRVISGIVTTAGTGTAGGHTRVLVVWSLPVTGPNKIGHTYVAT